ncbi:flagellar hook-associated protein FlgK [Noviherbaspirillum sp. CPCC 100848]|uniref:Flagellar hook-associated protein 1 n=1 Tax=Noviherbaspirillum album TaxID=3080276 RepID=A0ABU6JCJ7_9BURK|nr:flagellar hook-associated protein FlgK [Noviherbaspirillum sp. CPCC 100848]MEC4721366.1 flagellar hook-associated protein FlgK [Noviherbaspirillum sp. CPCC 100848]
MGSSILSVGQSALAAAQAGLATTGHNIANANTPGYSRQVVVQATAGSQSTGAGYIGKGATVVDVRRVFSDLLASQVRSAQSTQNQIQTYYTQVSQINNQLADTTAGLSPVLQDFFKGLQDLAANPNAVASRQAALSTAQALAARFNSLDSQLKEVAQGVNSQIASSVSEINTYAEQISKLNDAIEKASGNSGGKISNDLLDQRDYAITELSKLTQTTVVAQGNSVNVFVGSGQPLVVGSKTLQLVTMRSETDASRLEVGYQANGTQVRLPDATLTGGKLGGLMEFRANSMDAAQNALGRVAVGLAASFNAQHRLGQDQAGTLGGDFFVQPSARVDANKNNAGPPPAEVRGAITDASLLTTSDYSLTFAGGNYTVKRLSDGVTTYTGAGFPGGANQAIPGVTLSMPTAATAGDAFVIRPTVDGAAKFAVAIQDVSKIAAATPFRTAAPTTNTGSGKISAGELKSTALMPATAGITLTYTNGVPGQVTGLPTNKPITVTTPGVPPAAPTVVTYPAGTASVDYAAGDTITVDGVSFGSIPMPVAPATTTTTTISATATLTYDSATKTLSGFSPNLDISVRHADGTTTNHPAGSLTDIPYVDGDTFTTGGVSFTITGTPNDNDTFTISPNGNGVGDSRNAVLLGGLQTKNTLADGKATYQGAYAQLVSLIGNKTRELEVTNKAETAFLEQAETSLEAESGVNLDEEATNLIRFQQAYQAAAKVMQTASTLFDTLLTLGG